MIRSLVKLGAWLDKRFPEEMTVKKEDFVVLLTRMRHIEETSAHVDALKQVVLEMKKIKDEYASLKTSLGINGSAQSPPIAEAYLNDMPTGDFYDNQR